MALETGTYVSDLVITNPVGATDLKKQGDDHLRLIKNLLKATFPSADHAIYLERPQADVASAATTNIGAATSNYVRITGTTTITAFDSVAAGIWRFIRFADALTFTHSSTALILPGGLNITTAAGDTALAISLGSGDWIVPFYQKATGYSPISPMPKGHLHGLTLSNGTDATNDIDIAAGEARDDSNVVNMTLAAALTKQLDATWVVGTNQGGLDTGSIANDTYHIHLIKRSDTGVVDALFSISPTAPTMPANYDYSRRIGSVVRSAGALLAFSQLGDEFLWNAAVVDINATNPGTSAVTATLTVPTDIQVWAIISAGVYGGTSDEGRKGGVVSSPDVSNQVPQNGDTAALTGFNSFFAVEESAGTGVWSMASDRVRTNTSGQVRYRLSASVTSTRMGIITRGWVDMRGRLI